LAGGLLKHIQGKLLQHLAPEVKFIQFIFIIVLMTSALQVCDALLITASQIDDVFTAHASMK